jgi:hypothetical protein
MGIMAFIPAPRVARFQLFFTNSHEPAMYTWHVVGRSFDWDIGELNIFYGKIVTWWIGYGGLLASTSCSLDKIVGTDLSSEFGVKSTYNTGLPIPGTALGSPAPQNVTAAVSWHTGGRGRSYNGRTYLVGFVNEYHSGGVIVPNVAAFINTFYSRVITDISSTTYKFCLLSKQHNKVILNPYQSHEITDMTLDLNLDSQRRRLPGR